MIVTIIVQVPSFRKNREFKVSQKYNDAKMKLLMLRNEVVLLKKKVCSIWKQMKSRNLSDLRNRKINTAKISCKGPVKRRWETSYTGVLQGFLLVQPKIVS